MSDTTKRKLAIGLMASSGVMMVLAVGFGLLLWNGEPILAFAKSNNFTALVPGAKALGLTESYDTDF